MEMQRTGTDCRQATAIENRNQLRDDDRECDKRMENIHSHTAERAVAVRKRCALQYTCVMCIVYSLLCRWCVSTFRMRSERRKCDNKTENR